MHLKDLKKKTPADLVAQAEEMGIEGASTMRKQDLMFSILKVRAESGAEINGQGTIEVLNDGFGFLRSPEANYLAGPDDIYVAPNVVRRFGPTTQRDVFVAFFSAEETNRTEYQAGIPQALQLMNSAQFNARLQRHPAIRKGGTPEETIGQLYLSTLSRRPTEAEQERLARHVEDSKDPKAAYGDILWALINSSEFTLNH